MVRKLGREKDMKLIIAEKPSLARNIVAGIGQMDRKDGFFINSDYIVTWAFGHLFSLADIEAYTGTADSKWTLDNLPCFPDKFRFELRKSEDKKKVDYGVMKQFNLIETLCNRGDVDTIVNAGDADREGEIIVRLCVEHALKTKKRLMRLWLPDQTPQTVKRALEEMKDVLKKNMVEYSEQMAASQLNDKVLEALVAQCEEVEIPEEMMAAEVESAVARISQQMAQQGIPMEAYLQFYGKTMEQFRQDLRPQAENSIKARLALEEVARLENITVTDEELEVEVELMAAEIGIDVEQLKSLLGNGAAMDNMRKEIVVKKTAKVLADNAVITVEQM